MKIGTEGMQEVTERNQGATELLEVASKEMQGVTKWKRGATEAMQVASEWVKEAIKGDESSK
jgi:hypothetical protein